MPSRNVVKLDLPETYYHIYARGASRKEIFLDEADYQVFLNLLKRYLSKKPTKDANGREYTNYYDAIELIAYCLIPNHFHLMAYQHDEKLITALMRAVLTSYSRYFNNKYDRSGPLFETRYKSSRISSDTYLMHISRYIHLNPKNWLAWQWSSRDYFLGKYSASWVRPTRVLELFHNSPEKYRQFVDEYVERRDELKALVEDELAE